LSAKVSNVRLV